MPETHPRTLRRYSWSAIAVAALMLLGLGLRIWFVSVNELEPQLSPADDGDYFQRARRFATTGQYIDDFWLIRPPLHVFMFAGMLRISIILGNVDGVMLIRATQILMIVLTIPMGYALAKRLFNRWAGLIFAAILAVWYPLVELPVNLFSEPTFFFFLMLHLWLLVTWRDEQHWWLLVGSGVALGLGSLARSPTLYGVLFVTVWMVIWATSEKRKRAASDEQVAASLLRSSFTITIHRLPLVIPLRPIVVFVLACTLVVVPWTIRNYIVYQKFIMVDTIGVVNLWLHVEKYPEKGVEILKTMPQGERHVFSKEDTMRMFRADPVGFWQLLWRNAWFHFKHIWKAQFIEDFATKRSFYGRPLQATWPLGAAGDALWFVFTACGLAALAAPLREGSFRWLALLWLAYTIVAMMIMHIEPRYLLPVWLLLALYGSWFLSQPGAMVRMLAQHRLHGGITLVLVTGFLLICFTYRDYPALIATSLLREGHRASAEAAYQAGDYESAVQELEQAVAIHDGFVDSHAELALALIAQGRYDEAEAELAGRDSQRIKLARGELARVRENDEAAAAYFTAAEERAGEDVQRLGLTWLNPPATRALELGSGHDLGYVEGFSASEQVEQPGAPPLTYRWLQGHGRIILPLSQPLQPDSVVALRLTTGRPQAAPLHLGFVGSDETHQRITFSVAGGQWRVYYLPVPAALAGQQQLELSLDAPIFIPAHQNATTNDLRPLSLMVNAVWLEEGTAAETTQR